MGMRGGEVAVGYLVNGEWYYTDYGAFVCDTTDLIGSIEAWQPLPEYAAPDPMDALRREIKIVSVPGADTLAGRESPAPAVENEEEEEGCAKNRSTTTKSAH